MTKFQQLILKALKYVSSKCASQLEPSGECSDCFLLNKETNDCFVGLEYSVGAEEPSLWNFEKNKGEENKETKECYNRLTTSFRM